MIYSFINTPNSTNIFCELFSFLECIGSLLFNTQVVIQEVENICFVCSLRMGRNRFVGCLAPARRALGAPRHVELLPRLAGRDGQDGAAP